MCRVLDPAETEKTRQVVNNLLATGALTGAVQPLNRAGDTLVYLADALSDLGRLMAAYHQAGDALRDAGYGELADRIDQAEQQIGAKNLVREVPECLIETSADIRTARDLIHAAIRGIGKA